jgi:DNA polymerase
MPKPPAAAEPKAEIASTSACPFPDVAERGIEILQPPAGTKDDQLQWVRDLAEKSPEARGLGTLRDTMVFAAGSPEAEIAFVGEAPGHEEEQQREPFVGAAGQLLTKIIGAMGLSRETIYISNICKFRPKDGDGRAQGTRNRKPEPVEMASCLKYVIAELAIIRPKVIVALGATAMEGLLGVKQPVGAARMRQWKLGETPVVVTYHPSYLLHNGALTERRKVWENMMEAMAFAGMPVSEKQRAFFTKK